MAWLIRALLPVAVPLLQEVGGSLLLALGRKLRRSAAPVAPPPGEARVEPTLFDS